MHRPTHLKRFLNAALWTVQALWGIFFAFTGFGKMFCYNPVLWNRAQHQVAWFSAVPQNMMIFIGVCEFLGGVGLILPAATGIKPKLTPLSAAALALVMILAAVFHVMRGEYIFLPVNIVLGGVAAWIAYERTYPRPVAPASAILFPMLKGLAVLAAILIICFATLPVGWNK